MADEEEKNPNPMYLVPDILEEILLRVPLKSLLRFKIVSKQWKSIIESRRLRERRMEVEKKKKQTILAVKDRTKPSFQGDREEMEMVYMECDDAATRPLLTCDGLLCIPVPGWVNVLNPSTRQVLSFPSGPDPPNLDCPAIFSDRWWDHFPGFWEMGFGLDKVSGSYKVVRMVFYGNPRCEILDINIGEWRQLRPPSYNMYTRRKSVCVNGSIYWAEYNSYACMLALDLHTEEFRYLPLPRVCNSADQIVNLEGRVAIAKPDIKFWKLQIRILDAQEKTWTLTHTINLSSIANPRHWKLWFRPLVYSENGNLYLHDSENRLLKYDVETDVLTCLSSDICVLCPYVENLVSLAPPSSVSVMKTCKYQSGFHSLDHVPLISKIFGHIKPQIPKILLTTSLVSLVMFRSFVILSRSRRC